MDPAGTFSPLFVSYIALSYIPRPLPSSDLCMTFALLAFTSRREVHGVQTSGVLAHLSFHG